MQASRPSRTALRVALRRAAHQLFDAHPLVLDDPFAVPILPPDARAELDRTPRRPDRPHSVSLRAWMVVRSRYAEDCLAAACRLGVRQYVVLGAGLDTFALRNPHAGLRVFEIDHPATQAWKQNLLRTRGLSLPSSATLVPVNFECDDPASALHTAGFDRRQPAVFAWLGVVPYLTLPAFRATLCFLADSAAGSGVVLDYTQPRSVLPPLEQLAFDSLAARVQLAGEPFQLALTVEEMAAELAAFGDRLDLGSAELNARYLAGRTDTLRLIGSAGRLASAWIGSGPAG